MAAGTQETVLRLEYTLTSEEADEAYSLQLRHQLGGGSKALTWIMLILILVVAIGTFYFELEPQHRKYLLMGIPVIFAFSFLYVRLRRSGAKGAAVVELRDRGVRMPGPPLVDLTWEAFSDGLESERMFLLVDRQKYVGLCLPKRSFPDEASRDWFRQRMALIPRSGGQEQRQSAPMSEAASPRPGATRVHVSLRFRDILVRTLVWARGDAWGRGSCGQRVHHGRPGAARCGLFQDGHVSLLQLADDGGVRVPGPFRHGHSGVDAPESTPQAAYPTKEIPLPVRDALFRPKETAWSFIIWQGSGRVLFILPKRAFSTTADVQQTRKLLRRRLRQRIPWL